MMKMTEPSSKMVLKTHEMFQVSYAFGASETATKSISSHSQFKKKISAYTRG